MKNTVKKILALVFALAITASLFTVGVSAIEPGAVIGYAQPTDIVATINGYQIESYNVNGYTYICAEDLRYYGFDVVYNNYSRTLSVNRNYYTTNIDPQNTNPNFWSIGSNNSRKSILYTNITTYVNNEYVASSNVGGQTIINFNELARFGQVSYNNDRREISLVMSDVNVNSAALVVDTIEEMENDIYWTARVRAKGSLIVISLVSKTIDSLGDAGNAAEFSYRVTNGDIYEYYKEMIADCKDLGYNVTSVYVEYHTKDGSKIVSAQIY